MKWASAISETTSLDSAIGECVTQIKKQLDDVPPELAVIFVSSHYESEYDQAVEMVREKLGSPRVFGCSGGGIIGAGQEVEQRAAVSITAASLPGVEMVEFHLDGDDLPDMDAGPTPWEELVKVTPGQEPQFVILSDPFSFPVQNLIMGLDFAFAVSPTIEAPPARLVPRRPIEVVALAVRSHALPHLGPLDLGPIDLGPPDAVLDAATGWVLASVLALCQCNGLGVCPGDDWKSVRSPESIGKLSPVGIAWLITQAQHWARQVHETRPITPAQPPDDICTVRTVSDAKPHTLHASPAPLHAPLPAPLVQSTLELGAGR